MKTKRSSSVYHLTLLIPPQDLLSFELLDINIVQELERVPHNTPVGKHVPQSTSFILLTGTKEP